MTATLSDAIQRAKVAEWDAAEQQMAARFKLDPLVLSKDLLERHDLWAKWCAGKHVRKCPARPHAVATFLLEQNALGASAQVVVAMVEAIDAIHQYHGLSSPCATRVVNVVLEQILKVEPPRSWNRDEKAECKLPPRVREAITRRERDRDRALRRAQNKAAATNGAATTKSIQINGKGTEHHDHSQTQ
jgi:hypothetical protein